MIPTATELEHFSEVFRARHLSRTSLRLGITQPALTQSIKKLELKVGGKLFHRTPQGMIPTPLAEVVYRHASRLQDDWSGLRSDLRAAREGLQGRFRVGCHPSVASYCIPEVLRELDKAAPRIELELVHGFSRKVLEMVVGFEVDLGFVVNPIRHPDLVLKRLGKDVVRFWRKSGQTEIPRRLLVDLNLLQTARILGRAKGFESWSILQSENLEVVRTLALQGAGVGIIPERVALAGGAGLALYRENELPSFQDEIFLVYRKDVISSDALRILLKACSGALTSDRR